VACSLADSASIFQRPTGISNRGIMVSPVHRVCLWMTCVNSGASKRPDLMRKTLLSYPSAPNTKTPALL
jgi:hypothetical protein